MTFLLIFLHLCFFGMAFGKDCCPENSWPVRRSPAICSDDVTLMNLNCPNKFFLLDPNLNEYDKFIINEDGDQLLLIDASHNVSSLEFCIAPKWPVNETSFYPEPVAFVCFPEVKDTSDSDFVAKVFRIFMIISTIFLIATLIIYLVTPGVRDLSGKCIIAFIFCLISFYVSLICVQWTSSYSEEICVFLAFFTYFWSVSSFFWLNVITFNIWRSVMRKGFEISDNKCLIIYFCWGFGTPLLLMFTSLLVENLPGKHIKPNMGKIKCWFAEDKALWSFFYGPIAILLTVNVIMFILTSLRLQKHYEPHTPKRMKALRIKFMLHLKLFLLMGITWIFEIISFATPSTSTIQKIWFITDSLNTAQGIIIFFILVVFRKRVWVNILKMNFCGLKCPCASDEIEDEESDTKYELTSAEVVELTNSKGVL